MNSTRLGSDLTETNAQVILQVVKAIGALRELPDVLAVLTETLNPIVQFHAVSIVILEGEEVRVHWAHVKGVPRRAGDFIESMVARYSSRIQVGPPPMRLPVSHQAARLGLPASTLEYRIRSLKINKHQFR